MQGDAEVLALIEVGNHGDLDEHDGNDAQDNPIPEHTPPKVRRRD